MSVIWQLMVLRYFNCLSLNLPLGDLFYSNQTKNICMNQNYYWRKMIFYALNCIFTVFIQQDISWNQFNLKIKLDWWLLNRLMSSCWIENILDRHMKIAIFTPNVSKTADSYIRCFYTSFRLLTFPFAHSDGLTECNIHTFFMSSKVERSEIFPTAYRSQNLTLEISSAKRNIVNEQK